MKEKPASTAEKFKHYLYEKSTPRRAFTFLALWLITAILLDLNDRQLAATANGATKLDLRFGYD